MNRDENFFNILSSVHSSSSPSLASTPSSTTSKQSNSTSKRKRKHDRKGLTRANSLLDENSIFSTPSKDDVNEDLFNFPANRKRKGSERCFVQDSLNLSMPIIEPVDPAKFSKGCSPIWTSFSEIETTCVLEQEIERIARHMSKEYRILVLKEWILFINDHEMTYLTENEQTITFKEVFIQSNTLQLIIQSILRDLPTEEEEVLLWELFSQTLLCNSENFPLLQRLSTIHERIKYESESFKEMIYELVSNNVISRIKQTGEQRKVRNSIENWTKQISRVNSQLNAIDAKSEGNKNNCLSHTKSKFQKEILDLLKGKCIAIQDALNMKSTDLLSFENINDVSTMDILNDILHSGLEHYDEMYDGLSISEVDQQKDSTLKELDSQILSCENEINNHVSDLESNFQKKTLLEGQIRKLQEELKQVDSNIKNCQSSIQKLSDDKEDLVQQRCSIIEAYSEQVEALNIHSMVQLDRDGIKSEIVNLIEDCKHISETALDERRKILDRKLKPTLQTYFNHASRYLSSQIERYHQFKADAHKQFIELKDQQAAYLRGSATVRNNIEHQYKRYQTLKELWKRIHEDLDATYNSILQFKERMVVQFPKNIATQISIWNKEKIVRILPDLPWINTVMSESDTESVYYERES